MTKNYDKLLEKMILELKEKGIVPRLLLHSCCAPCSSYVIEYLSSSDRSGVVTILIIVLPVVFIWNSVL